MCHKTLPLTLFLIISFLILSGNVVRAQVASCPPNIDFEQGNLSHWKFYIGSCCPINANTATAPLSNRHVLTSGSGTDPYGNFPVVAYSSGSYSLKLGNDDNGSQSERARYYIHVPNNQSSYSFLYRYAVVFEDPGHVDSAQPRFEVRAFDSATNAPISCNQITYISSSNLPGFLKSSIGTDVYYKPWTSATIELSGYSGKTIALDFASGDCLYGAHFGYGYVDVNCGLFKTKAAFCNGDTTYTLNAPLGFEHYKWMDTNFTHIVDTTEIIVVNKSQAYTKYAIIVTPYQGFGCVDTFFTTLVEDSSSITAQPINDTSVCKGLYALRTASGVSNAQPLGYTWTPATGVSCTTCKTVKLNPVDTTTYTVVVNDAYGCRDTTSVTINVLPLPEPVIQADSAGCVDDSVTLTATASGSYSAFLWLPSNNMTGANTLTPRLKLTLNNPVYTIKMSNSYGCTDSASANIIVHDKPSVNAGSVNPVCPDDSTSLHGSVGPNTTFYWTPSTELSDSQILNPRTVVHAVKHYTLVATNIFGCTDSSQVYLYLNPVPIVDAGPDTVVCQGSSLRLHVSTGGIGNCTFNWSPQNKTYPYHTLQNPYVYTDSERIYRVVVKQSAGCSDSDEVKVSLYPKPKANAGPDTAVCPGFPAPLMGSSSIASVSYFWNTYNSIITNPFTDTTTAIVTRTTSFQLVVVTLNNCKDMDYMNVTVHPKPVADAGPDTGACLSGDIQLHGSGGVQYNWWPGTSLLYPQTDTPTLTVWNNGIYNLQVTNRYGCRDTDNVLVTLYPKPVANAGPDTAICRGKVLTLSGSGGVTYNWYPASLVFPPNIANPNIYVDSNMQYQLVVTNQKGCHDTDDVAITAWPLPVADAGPDTIACMGVQITLHGSGGGSYQWSPATDVSNPTIANPTVTVKGTKRYDLLVTNSYGCTKVTGVNVGQYPQPVAVTNNDTSVCPGIDISLSGSGGYDYYWSPSVGLSAANVSSPIAHISGNIDYTLVVTDTNGCKDSARVVIDTISFITGVDTPDVVCFGSPVSLSAYGGERYHWSPAELLDNADQSSPVATLDTTSVFTVLVSESLCGRTDTLKTKAVILPLPELKITVTDVDCSNDHGALLATGAAQYSWTPADGLSEPDAAYTTVSPAGTTRYLLTGTGDNGCVDTLSAEVKVFSGDGRLFLPDAFTPNGDGINDCYKVFVPGDVTAFEFSIYNRFGERVFHTTDRNQCWDGTYKGVPAELATYFYYYKATSSVCGHVFRKGDMHLIR